MACKKTKKKNKKKFSLKEFFKGFTLVELLAVIVILGIIMVIAIPNVLNTLEISKKKTFLEYVQKIYSTAHTKWLQETSMDGGLYEGEGMYVFNIRTDLGLSSTGSYKGYVCVVPANQVVEETQILVGLYDNNYMTQTIVSDEGEDTKDRYYINYTLYGEPKTDEIVNVNNYGIRDMEARYINTNSDVLPWGIGNLCYNKVTSS